MATRTYGAGTYGWGYYGLSMSFNLLSQSARNLYHDIWRDPNLVGFWPMNEGSSTPLYDHSLTNRNNATAVGAVAGSSAGALPAFSFDNSANHYVGMGHIAAVDWTSGSSWSALAVVNQTSKPAAAAIMGKYNSTAVQGWVWALNASGQQQVIVAAGPTSYMHRISCTTNVSGTPRMMGICVSPANGGTGSVLEPEDVIFYTDGVGSTVGTNGASFAVGVVTSTNEFRVGLTANSTYGFTGSIGFVALFNTKKTPIDFKRWARLGGFA